MSFTFITKPFKHQEELFYKIKDLPYFALLHDMGTGKSKLLIDLMRYHLNTDSKVLIVCPNSVTHNWRKEIKIHARPELYSKSVVLEGDKESRISLLKLPYNVFIINFEGLKVLEKELLDVPWHIVIIDEAQRIKSHKAQQTKIAIKIGDRSKIKYIATGTPILNSMLDIFCLYRFLDGGLLFGPNFFSFRNRYFKDINAGWKAKKGYYPKWVPADGLEDEIHGLIYTCSDRKLKSECLDLPPQVFEALPVPMTKEQEKAYAEMTKELIVFLDSGEAAVAQTALVKILRLSQITSGFLTTDTGSIIDIPSNKMKALTETIESIQPAKVIVWAHYRHDIERIFETLKEYNPVMIYGGSDERQAKIDRFQNDPNCKVFIGQPHSCGLGVTLTAASYCIYYSLSYSLEDRLQSLARCHRAGSEIHEKITVIDLVCPGTIDEVILSALNSKEDLSRNVIDLIKAVKNYE